MAKQLATILVVWCACILGASGTAYALACDAASASCDDAGTGDAGSDDAGALVSAAPDAAWADGPPKACSCDSDFAPDDEGQLHVCTGSINENTCKSFTCTEGTRAAVACSGDGVRLCCDMPSRKLYSQLYDDCTHPRCESGFRAQCEDFGGSIHSGPCQVPEDVVKNDDGGGICSAIPGHGGGMHLAAWMLLGAAVMLVRSGRRR